jgi:hypothetical protein
MSINVVAEEEFLVGTETVVMGYAPEGSLSAVFEDDGDTGYFYALDSSAGENSIQDAVHIYNVANVTDRDKTSKVTIGWSKDHQKVVLLINGYPHAIFDFAEKQGFCRTGSPPPNSKGEWSIAGHEWSDTAIKLFA